MKSNESVYKFTKALRELLSAGFSLPAALQIMGSMENFGHKERMASSEVLNGIEKGLGLAVAFSKNDVLSFKKEFISCIEVAEHSGNLEVVLGILQGRMEKESRFREKIGLVLVYPLFILLLCLILSLMIFFRGNEILSLFYGSEKSFLRNDIGFVLALANGFLILCVAIFLHGWMKLWKEMELRYFFCMMYELVLEKVDLATSIEVSLSGIVSYDLKRKVLKAQELLKKGCRLGDVFKSFGKECGLCMEFSEFTSSSVGGIKSIKELYERKTDSEIDKVIQFVEPASMIVLGIYLLILFCGILFPLLDSVAVFGM